VRQKGRISFRSSNDDPKPHMHFVSSTCITNQAIGSRNCTANPRSPPSSGIGGTYPSRQLETTGL